MNFIRKLFHSERAQCPRCLGKGTVDTEDIRRLKMELFWGTGKCAYCNGKRTVPPSMIQKVPPNLEYLTNDLSRIERYKVINGKEDALERAAASKERVMSFVAEIRHLYYIKNLEPEQIVNYLIAAHGIHDFREGERQEVMEYINKVISTSR